MADRMQKSLEAKLHKHNKELTDISTKAKKSLEEQKKSIETEFSTKRNRLIEELSKARARELDVISKYQQSEDIVDTEYYKMPTHLDPLDRQYSLDIIKRQQLIDEMAKQTQYEIKLAIDRHNDRIKRIEYQLTLRTAQEKRLYETQHNKDKGVADTVALKDKQLSESFESLEQIRSEIQEKIQDLAALDHKEAKELLQLEKKFLDTSKKDRREEMNRFVDKAKRVFRS